MRESFDAIVIGAGVIGSSVTHALAADGWRVCAVDGGPTAGSGSTSASSAVVRFNYSTFAGVAAAWESRHAWQDWAGHLGGSDDAGLAGFFTTGGLTLDTPRQDRTRVLSLFDEVGVEYEDWDAATIRERLPLLETGRYYPPKALSDDDFWDAGPDGELTGYWTPDSGFIDDPQLAAHNLMTAARRHGATFKFRSRVTAVHSSGRITGVTLADGSELSAPVVVNVAGPHSGAVNELAGVGESFTVHTRPLRQEVHEVRAPEGYSPDGPGPLVADTDLGTYFRGTPSGGLIVGGTEPECDELQWLEDPDAYHMHPTQALYAAQVYRAARRLPTLQVPGAPRGVAGVYDVADDWTPIYDRTELPGYYVAIGTSGNQFKNAPVVGQFLTAIIRACENGHDHDQDPVHVALPRTGHKIDLSQYSRMRPVDGDGAASGVMG
ncbi:N-methyltryptophan oxidase [Streptomyces sp. YIM 130001]|uniref:NAD(P)/FAD-dependent oxidoreductase n=1 Tax=Streptomyces sp. YIM 130001 TaxID=2259644 RepID=UPI000E65629A|nr:FAD-dependent oxidoreductase [Streptomyces sp. YIM 130001]RII20647.1 N-methyltryptophan oxidase [Streptomyces sp. YIM 130001]